MEDCALITVDQFQDYRIQILFWAAQILLHFPFQSLNSDNMGVIISFKNMLSISDISTA